MSSVSADFLDVEASPAGTAQESSVCAPAAAAARTAGDADNAISTAAAGNAGSGAPARLSRRALLRRCGALAAVGVAGGVYGREIEPFWIEEHDVPMPIRGLPADLAGLRIMHLSDLHASSILPLSYLRRVVKRVNERAPDVVVITGDLVTHAMAWVAPVCEVLAALKAPVAVSFGNHDYAVTSMPAGLPTSIADALQAHLTANGAVVLRNSAVTVTRQNGRAVIGAASAADAGRRLWLVGLEDLWSGRFSPQVAFAGVDNSEPCIALSHNPDTCDALDAYEPQLILAGHTHGGQIRIPGIGAILLNVQNRAHDMGLFQLAHSRLYVSRGVGYLRQIRLYCRPEMPCFVLENA